MTIRELVGDIEVTPQYSATEALSLVDEYQKRLTLEGEVMELEARHYRVSPQDNRIVWMVEGMSNEQLRDHRDWHLEGGDDA